MSLQELVLSNVQPHLEHIGDKVSIIGAGIVGTATAVCLLGMKITNNLVLVDVFGEKVNGEVLDIQLGSLFLNCPRITGGNDFSITQGSKLCIITAGVRKEIGETRLALAQKNTDIMVKLIPEIVKYSPDTLILMVGNPSEVLTYVAWKVSGLPQYRVFGVGTTLDTQRFKVAIGKKLEVNPDNVHAWIIGEQGNKSIPLWSSINISGIRLKILNPLIGTEGDPENWQSIHKEVTEATSNIEELKGYTNWGVSMSVAAITKAVLDNKLSVFPVSVNAKGRFGIKDDVFIPLPSVVGGNGITDIVNIQLSEDEMVALQDIAKSMKGLQDGVKIKGADISCRCRRCRK